MRPHLISSDRLLGLVMVLLALVVLAIWIPLDVETGLVEKMRRQIRLGDSLLPALAMGFVLLGALMVIFTGKPGSHGLSRENLGFLVVLLACLAVAFALMRWLGPLAVWATGEEATYRSLRDTAPWKYLGFVTGGTVLVTGLMAIAEGRLTVRGLVVGVVASLVLVAIYDLPFDDLLLPPNGDV